MLSGKELGNLDQLVFTRWQKKTVSQYLLPEGFKTFIRSAPGGHFEFAGGAALQAVNEYTLGP